MMDGKMTEEEEYEEEGCRSCGQTGEDEEECVGCEIEHCSNCVGEHMAECEDCEDIDLTEYWNGNKTCCDVKDELNSIRKSTINDLKHALKIRRHFNAMDEDKFMDMLEKHLDWKISKKIRKEWKYMGLDNCNLMTFIEHAKEDNSDTIYDEEKK